MIYVILNEQHQLMSEQKKILNDKYDDWKLISIPSKGLTRIEIDEFEDDYGLSPDDTIIFASPVPYLLKKLASSHWSGEVYGNPLLYNVLVFHNDHREKVELPNSKIIMKVAEIGWELI